MRTRRTDYPPGERLLKLLVEDGKITGVRTYSSAVYHCKAVILCTGTYLKARCIYGDESIYRGQMDCRQPII